MSTVGVSVLLLNACSSISADNCSVGRQVGEGNQPTCTSARHARSTLFSGDDFPRLWTGDEERREGNVDASALNRLRRAPPGTAAVGYMGSTRLDFPYDEAAISADIQDAESVSKTKFDPAETLTVKFDKVTLDFFLKQMLTGALGVAYVAPDDLGGSVSFRTEQPLPKAQVLQVVRDILGRRGLVMKNLNGVFQIDRADVVAAIESAAKAGRENEQNVRVLRVPKGSAAELVTIVRQLVPEDVTLVPTGGAIIVKASSPADVNNVSDMISALNKNGIGDDKVMIVRLRQASPGRIATQITEFYKSRQTPQDGLTIIPLENQNSLLIGAKDARLAAGVRKLAEQLDRDAVDEATVRIIQLTHITAEETAQRLSSILNSGGGSGNNAGSNAGPPAAAASASSSPASFEPAAATSSSPFGALTLPSGRGSGGGGGGGGEAGGRSAGGGGAGNSAGAGGQSRSGGASAPPSEVASTIRLEPDVRNNALMVFSNYAMFKRVQDVVKVIDVPQAQVVIEATIAEVSITDDLQFGVQTFLSRNGFTARNSIGGTTTDPGTAGTALSAGFSLGNVQANVVLTALQAVTNVKVISSPYLTVLDKKTARLVIGDQIPFAQTTQSSSNQGAVTVTENIQVKDTGVVLEVTPRINSNNSVTLTIDQQISKPAETIKSGDRTPIIATRQVKSDILVQSGRTFLLGGIMQERIDKSESGTPLLRGVPVVGDLFKTQANTASRVELLVMITPRVVRQSPQLEQITRLLRDQLHVR